MLLPLNRRTNNQKNKNKEVQIIAAMSVSDIIKQGEQLVDRFKHQSSNEMTEITREGTNYRESGDDDESDEETEPASMDDNEDKDKYERGKSGV